MDETIQAWSLQLQLWGGLCYLLHKIFSFQYERTKKDVWLTTAWIVYIAGLPAVVAILLKEHNWIFAWLELSALPLMILGLILAAKKLSGAEIGLRLKVLDPLVYILIGIGLGYSLRDFGGLTTLNQGLELGASGGFLIGTYLQGKKNPRAYLFYILMNLSAGVLLWRENYIWFTLQQIASIGFIVAAWYMSQRKSV